MASAGANSRNASSARSISRLNSLNRTRRRRSTGLSRSSSAQAAPKKGPNTAPPPGRTESQARQPARYRPGGSPKPAGPVTASCTAARRPPPVRPVRRHTRPAAPCGGGSHPPSRPRRAPRSAPDTTTWIAGSCRTRASIRHSEATNARSSPHGIAGMPPDPVIRLDRDGEAGAGRLRMARRRIMRFGVQHPGDVVQQGDQPAFERIVGVQIAIR